MSQTIYNAYRISTGLLGAPDLEISVLFEASTQFVIGTGRLTQATNPPVNLNLRIIGNYKDITVNGSESCRVVTLNGYLLLKWPSKSGTGPVESAVLDLSAVLNPGLTQGTASFSYFNGSSWVDINDAKVTPVLAG